MSADSHDRMIHAFQEYFKWKDRFEHRGSDHAGVRARYWLSEIRNEASLRRTEIQAKRDERKQARKGMVGRPKKIST